MRIKKVNCFLVMAISAIFMLSLVTPLSFAAEPRYIDIATADCDFYISNSIASCTVRAIGKAMDNEYRITMVLYQDDNDYATWDIEGTSIVNETKSCYVTSGHEYYVGIHIRVYDPAGNFIEQLIGYTDVVYY